MSRAGRVLAGAVVIILAVAVILSRKTNREIPTEGSVAVASPTPGGATVAATPPPADAPRSESSPNPEARSAAVPAGTRGDSPELAKLRAAATASLPTTASFRGKSEVEVHGTPAEILDAGRRLGELAEYLETHPAEIPAALPTYSDCAGDEKVVSTVRALCAYRLKVYEKAWNPATRSRYSKIPASIRDLAKQLDGT